MYYFYFCILYVNQFFFLQYNFLVAKISSTKRVAFNFNLADLIISFEFSHRFNFFSFSDSARLKDLHSRQNWKWVISQFCFYLSFFASTWRTPRVLQVRFVYQHKYLNIHICHIWTNIVDFLSLAHFFGQVHFFCYSL